MQFLKNLKSLMLYVIWSRVQIFSSSYLLPSSITYFMVVVPQDTVTRNIFVLVKFVFCNDLINFENRAGH